MQANASQNMGKSEYQIPVFFKNINRFFFQKMTALSTNGLSTSDHFSNFQKKV